MFRLTLLRAVCVTTLVAIALPAMAIDIPMSKVSYERGGGDVTLDSASGSATYSFTETNDAWLISVLAGAEDATWEGAGSPDYIQLVLTPTASSGTLPDLSGVSAVLWSGNTVGLGAVSRTFGSAGEARDFAVSVAAARALSNKIDASLSESGGDITLRIDLDEVTP